MLCATLFEWAKVLTKKQTIPEFVSLLFEEEQWMRLVSRVARFYVTDITLY